MRIALTGTPGVGKTTVGALAAQRGWRVVDVKQWAHDAGAVVAHDAIDAADVIDVAKLVRLARAEKGDVVYEGHLSHQLPVDVAWVLRCDPRILERRLRARGYSDAKIAENLEAEALDLILQEALATVPRVIQRDATKRTPEALIGELEAATQARRKGHDLEPVDWSDQLPIRLGARHGA